WLYRSPAHRLQAQLVGGAAVLQALSCLWVSRDFSLLQRRFELGDWAPRVAAVLQHHLLQPMVGDVAAARALSILCRLAGGGRCLEIPSALGWTGLVLLGLAVFALVGELEDRRDLLLPASFLTLAAAVSASTGPALGQGRYAVLPGLLFLLLLVWGAGRGPSGKRVACAAFALLALVVGAATFRDEGLAGSLGREPGRPDWRQEVARWRQDPSHLLAIWPYTPRPWHLSLQAAGEPPPARWTAASPAPLVSLGQWSESRLEVHHLPPTFQVLLDLTPSAPPETVDLELRLLDGAGEALAVVALKDFEAGRPRQYLLEPRHFRGFADGLSPGELRNFEAVETLALAVRSTTGRPAQVQVWRFAWTSTVKGLLEPWLPSDRGLAFLGLLTLAIAGGGSLLRRHIERQPLSAAEALGRHPYLEALLAALVVLPALAFAFGLEDGHVAFVLYREPKRLAISLLGWVFVVAAAWRLRPTRRELADVLESSVGLSFLAFLAALAWTHRWVLVKENFLYEAEQYLLLTLLLVLLSVWASRWPALRRQVARGLCLSLALVCLVSLVQMVVEIPFLAPIDPELGTAHPSFMGYKNPMALALLGQLFLVAERAWRLRGRRSGWLWTGVLAVEVALLASLESRTAYLGFAVGLAVLVALAFVRRPGRRLALRLAAGTASALALVVLVWTVSPAARQRAHSLWDILRQPAAYGDTDRGTYLRNTLQMVRHHPLGVGLGDWQTWYPVYRLHNRDLAFDEAHQVRRAHSDHVQILGEAGWPGFAAWLLFLAVLLFTVLRRALAEPKGDPWPFDAFLAAQLLALVYIMAGDYFLEMPFHKFLFVLLVFLALGRTDDSRPAAGAEPERAAARGRPYL
ncbi:MAG: O-antigen ligase family protein, partial [Acidobacteria bacterium]|nr:O-antigen ligase family protein [Acidobacteriota bacterium]